MQCKSTCTKFKLLLGKSALVVPLIVEQAEASAMALPLDSTSYIHALPQFDMIMHVHCMCVRVYVRDLSYTVILILHALRMVFQAHMAYIKCYPDRPIHHLLMYSLLLKL